MTAQSVHHAQPPRIPNTPKGIRSFLAAGQRAVFDAEWQNLDLADLSAVARFRDRWWGAAMVATNPRIQADLDALERGELEFCPSPFAR
jgi:hypothetical protein